MSSPFDLRRAVERSIDTTQRGAASFHIICKDVGVSARGAGQSVRDGDVAAELRRGVERGAFEQVGDVFGRVAKVAAR